METFSEIFLSETEYSDWHYFFHKWIINKTYTYSCSMHKNNKKIFILTHAIESQILHISFISECVGCSFLIWEFINYNNQMK